MSCVSKLILLGHRQVLIQPLLSLKGNSPTNIKKRQFYPFCGRYEVRRREEARLEAVLTQDRLAEGARRPLPFSPAHMNDR